MLLRPGGIIAGTGTATAGAAAAAVADDDVDAATASTPATLVGAPVPTVTEAADARPDGGSGGSRSPPPPPDAVAAATVAADVAAAVVAAAGGEPAAEVSSLLVGASFPPDACPAAAWCSSAGVWRAELGRPSCAGRRGLGAWGLGMRRVWRPGGGERALASTSTPAPAPEVGRAVATVPSSSAPTPAPALVPGTGSAFTLFTSLLLASEWSESSWRGARSATRSAFEGKYRGEWWTRRGVGVAQ